MAAVAIVGPMLTAPMFAAPAFAASAASAAPAGTFVAGPGVAAPSSTAPASKPAWLTPLAQPAVRQDAAINAAITKARTSGIAVPVPAETTETETVTANPSGTVTVSSNVLPVRVRRDGAWTPIDPTLHRSADGGYAPAATWGPLSLSGGGTGTLATLGTRTSGLSLTWPGRLPTPSISGAAATYRDVLPGVDLVVTATDLGGVSEVLTVHDAKAAANPALSALTFGLATHGLTVSDDGNGNLRATDSRAQLAYEAPAATMWDSSGAATAAARTQAAVTPADAVTSGVAGPGRGARVAKVAVSVSGGGLTLRPDQSLLRGADTEFPVYVDPTWNPNYGNGAEQGYDEIQQGCPTTSNYNSTTYGEPAVGYNDFSGCIGKERSFFRVGIPSAVWGTHIVTATVNTIETYSSSCSATATVHLWSTGAISGSTTWSHAPAMTTDVTSQSVGPACTSSPSVAFTVTSTIAAVAKARSGSWTFGLIGNETTDLDRKRFQHNPSIQIEYNNIPGVPSSPSAAAGSANVGCATVTPYPWMGSTAGVTPPTMQAKVTDADGGQVQGTFTYWVDGTTTTHTLTSTVASAGTAKVSLPSSFITSLAAGQIVDWEAQAYDGKDTSAWTPVCHFGVDLTAPPAPTITSPDGKYPSIDSGLPGAPAGTAGQFKLAVATGTTATAFVYGLDVVPPTSNPPAAQKITATSGTATVPATPLAPGTHTLWSYALDQAGNESGLAGYTFGVLGHANVTYSSLAAAFNNTAISSDTAIPSANADGDGNSLSAQDLTAAGWQSGGKVTIDGATFTLPTFGGGQADNVLAANQTITMPAGTKGSALVFLAISTAAYAQAPDGLAGDVTSPAVPAGSAITGTGCTYVNGVPSACQPASGAISYGSAAPAQSYYLTVPDWITGPQAESVIQLPHRNKLTGQVLSNPKVYAFAVPLNPSVALSSVTLPDVSNSLAQLHMPGLHIFGMAVRNTTAAPAGASWTGAWSGPNEGSFNILAGANYGNQTFRIAATPSVVGTSVRIRLSDALGANPLTVDHVTVATEASGAGATGAPVNVTFGGAAGLTIPIGGDAYSDPLTFAVSPLQPLLVSIHLVNSVTYLVQHGWAQAGTTMWVSPVGSGDHTADTASTAWSATGSHWGYFTDILTGIDVTSAGNPGTVAVLGNNLVAPTTAGMTAISVGRQDLSVGLGAALRGNTQGVTDFGVVDDGIENNGVLRDVIGTSGVSSLARLDRDVLAEPGIGTVVVNEGLSDLANGVSGADLVDAYSTLAAQLNAWGITVIFETLTPCDGYAPCTAAVDTQRLAANDWIGDQSTFLAPYIYSADANAAVAVDDPASTSTPPEQKLNNATAPAGADSGDHVNLTNTGYAALTATIPLTELTANTPPQY